MLSQSKREELAQIAEDLYAGRGEAVALANELIAQSELTDDAQVLAALKAKYDKLVAKARKAQQVADKIECELIWDLPAYEKGA